MSSLFYTDHPVSPPSGPPMRDKIHAFDNARQSGNRFHDLHREVVGSLIALAQRPIFLMGKDSQFERHRISENCDLVTPSQKLDLATEELSSRWRMLSSPIGKTTRVDDPDKLRGDARVAYEILTQVREAISVVRQRVDIVEVLNRGEISLEKATARLDELSRLERAPIQKTIALVPKTKKRTRLRLALIAAACIVGIAVAVAFSPATGLVAVALVPFLTPCGPVVGALFSSIGVLVTQQNPAWSTTKKALKQINAALKEVEKMLEVSHISNQLLGAVRGELKQHATLIDQKMAQSTEDVADLIAANNHTVTNFVVGCVDGKIDAFKQDVTVMFDALKQDVTVLLGKATGQTETESQVVAAPPSVSSGLPIQTTAETQPLPRNDSTQIRQALADGLKTVATQMESTKREVDRLQALAARLYV